MATSINIVEKINKAVEVFGKSTEKPPFGEEQLVVLAILASGNALSAKQIFDWILENFRYYDHLARTALWNFSIASKNAIPMEARSVVEFRSNFDKVFWQFELPLETQDVVECPCLYNISSVNGWAQLADILDDDKPSKPFPFFELPAEIRNSIYEFVFQYPDSGITILPSARREFCHHGGGDRLLGVVSRSSDDDFSFHKWDDAISWRCQQASPFHDRVLRTRLLRDILAPLATNRQFFEEAMPLFYQLNRFYFRRLYDLCGILRCLAPGRRKYIKHIAFNYDQSETAASGLRRLLELESLTKLDIKVLPRTVQTTSKGPNARGLHTLCRLRGLESVTLEGECEPIRSRVMESVMLPQGAPMKRKRGRRD